MAVGITLELVCAAPSVGVAVRGMLKEPATE